MLCTVVRTKSRRRVFPRRFRVLLNFHECFYLQLDRNTGNMFSTSFRKHRVENKVNLLGLVSFDYPNANPLWSRHKSCVIKKL